MFNQISKCLLIISILIYVSNYYYFPMGDSEVAFVPRVLKKGSTELFSYDRYCFFRDYLKDILAEVEKEGGCKIDENDRKYMFLITDTKSSKSYVDSGIDIPNIVSNLYFDENNLQRNLFRLFHEYRIDFNERDKKFMAYFACLALEKSNKIESGEEWLELMKDLDEVKVVDGDGKCCAPNFPRRMMKLIRRILQSPDSNTSTSLVQAAYCCAKYYPLSVPFRDVYKSYKEKESSHEGEILLKVLLRYFDPLLIKSSGYSGLLRRFFNDIRELSPSKTFFRSLVDHAGGMDKRCIGYVEELTSEVPDGARDHADEISRLISDDNIPEQNYYKKYLDEKIKEKNLRERVDEIIKKALEKKDINMFPFVPARVDGSELKILNSSSFDYDDSLILPFYCILDHSIPKHLDEKLSSYYRLRGFDGKSNIYKFREDWKEAA